MSGCDDLAVQKRLVLAEDSDNYTFNLTYLNIWRNSPPGRRTNRPSWQVLGCQAAHSALDCHYLWNL